jgi:hypothetical protein
MRFANGTSRAASSDLVNRRLVFGVLLSMLLHALLLLLQFGIPGIGLPARTPPISITLARVSSAPPATAEPPAAEPAPSAPGLNGAPSVTSAMRLMDPIPLPQVAPVAPKPAVKKGKSAKAPRISRPLPDSDPAEPVTRVIAQDQKRDDSFVVPLPNPPEADQKTIDPNQAQHGADDGSDAANAALEAEAALAAQLAEAKRNEELAAQQAAEALARIAAEDARRQDEQRKAALELEARKQAQEENRQAAAARQKQVEELATQQRVEQLAEQQKAEQLAAQQKTEQLRAEQLAAQQQEAQQKAAQLAAQHIADQLAARKKAEELAAQQLAQEQAERRKAADLVRPQAEDAARQQAQEAARQQLAEQAAAQQRERERAAASALAGNAAPAGPASGSGGRGATGSSKLPGMDLGSRARELVRGLDILGAAPAPLQRPREDDERAHRRVVASGAERDLPLRMYVDSFRQKIERNGALNYSSLSSQRVRIDPLVSVAIRSDGSVDEVTIVRSSGRADTDEAVRRIVRVNARYSIFPPNVAVRYDVIEIRRIWRFDEQLKLLEEIP